MFSSVRSPLSLKPSAGLDLFFVVFVSFCRVESSKQRSWLGPSQFFEGTAPSQRWLHGFVMANSTLYIFGGLNSDGLANFFICIARDY